ncbi:MAG: hypothetical protein H6923_07270 [Alphaproteobacteria bacterium]|nr:hypothetical protein [Alphaproteobacteria bacterium]
MSERSAVLFVPMQEEMEYAYNTLKSRGGTCSLDYDKKTDRYPFTWTLGSRTIVTVYLKVIGDHGNLRTATRMAQTLIDVDPYFCLLVGIGGAMEPPGNRTLGLEDVVISTRVKTLYPDKVKRRDASKEDYAPGLPIQLDQEKKFLTDSFFRFRRDAIQWQDSTFLLDGYLKHLNGGTAAPLSLYPVTPDTVNGLDLTQQNPKPKVAQGTIFSSEMVIDSDEYIDYLIRKNLSDASDYYVQKDGKNHPRQGWFSSTIPVADMESLGFFEMIGNLKGRITTTHAVSVRGISDFASQKQNLDETTFDKVREKAVANAITVALDMLDWSGALNPGKR